MNKVMNNNIFYINQFCIFKIVLTFIFVHKFIYYVHNSFISIVIFLLNF